ncbi:cobalt ABC transporter substrate-bindng protein [Salipaludibacillus neizhouensis]|uniref:Cobalt ABC transporter substrate-bindng protein n=1 Tax=Salipaludibacillus neizhouensis TaxID=885475 RepID=A0A3A9K1Q6_9BACI|nr:DUF4198 domain-containing protein [Salipaludibacillus neizhouensis]RKL67034.1 cobalt ABC transporter substrate-bindng protein [Salipaludibacillus neizhouensis]
MRKIILLSFILLVIGTAEPVKAHDGWTQTNATIVEPEENIYIELLFGNHSNDHGSYRIEGNWNEDNTKVNVHTPAGEAVDVTSTLFYTGELDESDEGDSGVNNYHIASFSAIDTGIYIISGESDSIFSQGETSSRTLRSAKSFAAVSDVPTFHEAKGMDGFGEEVTQDRAEFLPQFNPVALMPEETVEVQLAREGSPVQEEEVTLVRRSTSESEVFLTDEEGMISFTSGPADYYLLRASEETEGEGEEYNVLNYEATMTFAVQNGEDMNGMKKKRSQKIVTQTLLANRRTLTSKINLITGVY